MARYTTVRISLEDKERLEKLSKKLNRSLVETLRFAIVLAEREADRFRGDPEIVLSSLKHARDIGETDAEKVDEYLYGGAD